MASVSDGGQQEPAARAPGRRRPWRVSDRDDGRAARPVDRRGGVHEAAVAAAHRRRRPAARSSRGRRRSAVGRGRRVSRPRPVTVTRDAVRGASARPTTWSAERPDCAAVGGPTAPAPCWSSAASCSAALACVRRVAERCADQSCRSTRSSVAHMPTITSTSTAGHGDASMPRAVLRRLRAAGAAAPSSRHPSR